MLAFLDLFSAWVPAMLRIPLLALFSIVVIVAIIRLVTFVVSLLADIIGIFKPL